MNLEFAKMHGLGNDFVVFDGVRQAVELTRERIRAIADRRFGIGCDQVLVLEPAERSGVDFAYRIYNADGGEVEQCGNGARCVALFAREAGLTDKDRLRLETLGGEIMPRILPDGRVTVDMGVPHLEGADIPLSEPGEWVRAPLEVAGERRRITAVSVGNPHCVLEVEDATAAPLSTLGPVLEHHPLFPNRANVEFVEVRSPDRIRVRVWERGAGVTLACGTGACASVVAARLWDRVGPRAEVELDGGNLTIEWAGPEEPILMTGPAVITFRGVLGQWPASRPATAGP
ncbi:diaminopimelate epimerase [Thiohalorhabdus methylotrophus]|uniref:Diaminopimelate epimerase n=1 Tax=Thiohalorhabdus methylotrophus TaxID=3242694 RepID=A0ABV4TWV8_9GAMM